MVKEPTMNKQTKRGQTEVMQLINNIPVVKPKSFGCLIVLFIYLFKAYLPVRSFYST